MKDIFNVKHNTRVKFGQLRRNYLNLVLRIHPDKVSAELKDVASEVMKIVSQAHETAKEFVERICEGGKEGQEMEIVIPNTLLLYTEYNQLRDHRDAEVNVYNISNSMECNEPNFEDFFDSFDPGDELNFFERFCRDMPPTTSNQSDDYSSIEEVPVTPTLSMPTPTPPTHAPTPHTPTLTTPTHETTPPSTEGNEEETDMSNEGDTNAKGSRKKELENLYRRRATEKAKEAF